MELYGVNGIRTMSTMIVASSRYFATLIQRQRFRDDYYGNGWLLCRRLPIPPNLNFIRNNVRFHFILCTRTKSTRICFVHSITRALLDCLTHISWWFNWFIWQNILHSSCWIILDLDRHLMHSSFCFWIFYAYCIQLAVKRWICKPFWL